MAAEPPHKQLHMVWPEWPLDSPPEPVVPPGYELRVYAEADEAAYLALMAAAGFDGWTHERLAELLPSVLPEGHFVVVHEATGELAATAMARHRPSELHPDGGELAWVAGRPAHRGKGLGMAVCAAVTKCFLRAAYRRIYLQTDDFRLAALKIYLKLGYEPFLYCDGMAERWGRVFRELGWKGQRDEDE